MGTLLPPTSPSPVTEDGLAALNAYWAEEPRPNNAGMDRTRRWIKALPTSPQARQAQHHTRTERAPTWGGEASSPPGSRDQAQSELAETASCGRGIIQYGDGISRVLGKRKSGDLADVEAGRLEEQRRRRSYAGQDGATWDATHDFIPYQSRTDRSQPHTRRTLVFHPPHPPPPGSPPSSEPLGQYYEKAGHKAGICSDSGQYDVSSYPLPFHDHPFYPPPKFPPHQPPVFVQQPQPWYYYYQPPPPVQINLNFGPPCIVPFTCFPPPPPPIFYPPPPPPPFHDPDHTHNSAPPFQQYPERNNFTATYEHLPHYSFPPPPPSHFPPTSTRNSQFYQPQDEGEVCSTYHRW